jgi:hypothetical protein
VDISSTTAPDSTQVNADDLIGGPVTVTITGVRKGTPDQPVNIDLAEFPDRAYRPGKSMRRLLVAAWGPEASEYVGRRMTMYRDASISFGRDVVGGIRLSHLSHIDKPLTVALTVTRGKRSPFTVEPLVETGPTAADVAASADVAELRSWWPPAGPELRKAIEARVAELQEGTSE